MLSYTFSRREKTLILVLALIVIGLVWYVLVYQRTTNEIANIDGEMGMTQTEITQAQTQVTQMNSMKAVIDDYKARGVSPTPVPNYDNSAAVMAELNGVLATTDTYSLAFDAVTSSTTASDYMLRGVRVNFSCASRGAAESIIRSLASGPYPCSIDSISLSDAAVGNARSSAAAPVTVTAHITYLERQVK